MEPTLATHSVDWIPLVAALALVCSSGLAIRAYLRYRGRRLVDCPVDGACAEVELNAAYAATTSALVWQELRVARCSSWPRQKGCGEACVARIEAAPRESLISTIVSRWHSAQR